MPIYRVYVTCPTWQDFITVGAESPERAIDVAEELLDFRPSWGCKVRCEEIMTDEDWLESVRESLASRSGDKV